MLLGHIKIVPYLCGVDFAIVAQLVERWLPKPKVAGSCPVYRSEKKVPVYGAFSNFGGLSVFPAHLRDEMASTCVLAP